MEFAIDRREVLRYLGCGTTEPDEATAALDAQTARAVADAILDIEGLTRVIVTHRMDARLMRRYDEILVLHGGTICEHGTFDDLMARRGMLYSLYTVSQVDEKPA